MLCALRGEDEMGIPAWVRLEGTVRTELDGGGSFSKTTFAVVLIACLGRWLGCAAVSARATAAELTREPL